MRTACLVGLFAAPACAVSSADKIIEKPGFGSEDHPVHGAGDAGSDDSADSDDESSDDDSDQGETLDAAASDEGDKPGDGDSTDDGDARPDAATPPEAEHDAGSTMTCDPAACSDNVACTDDVCAANGQCEHRANDARCAAGATCTPTGCMAGEGASCTSSNMCPAGSVCTGPSGLRTCQHLCETNTDCTAKDSLCAIPVGGGQTVCSPSCNPILQTGCSAGTHCVIDRPVTSGPWVTDCAANDPSATGEQDDLCDQVLDDSCAPGYLCVDAGGFSDSCLQYCLKNSDCPAGYLCQGQLDTPMTVGKTTYKLCI
jgi:hypothetical protein